MTTTTITTSNNSLQDGSRSRSLPPPDNLLEQGATGPDPVPSKLSPSGSSSVATDDDSGYGAHVRGMLSPGAIETASMAKFYSKDEFLLAMSEDLAEWFSHMYPQRYHDLDSDNFYERLSDGILLCSHAGAFQETALVQFPGSAAGAPRFLGDIKSGGIRLRLPQKPPLFSTRCRGAALTNNPELACFIARDNVANFIKWLRDLGFSNSILFETEDLIMRKNLHSVIICLLELARFGGKMGLQVPEIVRLEQEIEEELLACSQSEEEEDEEDQSESIILSGEDEEEEALDEGLPGDSPEPHQQRRKRALKVRKRLRSQLHNSLDIRTDMPSRYMDKLALANMPKPKPQRPVVDMRSLDEMVREILSECTCEQIFPMERISDGRYKFGDKSQQIFVKILRSHVMVRVGGGWDTLNNFLLKHDECRKQRMQNNASPNGLLISSLGGFAHHHAVHHHSSTFQPREATIVESTKSPVPINPQHSKPKPAEQPTVTVVASAHQTRRLSAISSRIPVRAIPQQLGQRRLSLNHNVQMPNFASPTKASKMKENVTPVVARRGENTPLSPSPTPSACKKKLSTGTK